MNTDGNEYDCPSEKETLVPYVVVQNETGFCNVTISDYYKVDFNGLKNTKDYSAEKIDKQPILTENRQEKTLEYDATALAKLHFALYSTPNLSSPKKAIKFKESNSLKFQYCTQTPSHFWISVTINGVDGFMLLGSLEKLGFEKCEQ